MLYPVELAIRSIAAQSLVAHSIPADDPPFTIDNRYSFRMPIPRGTSEMTTDSQRNTHKFRNVRDVNYADYELPRRSGTRSRSFATVQTTTSSQYMSVHSYRIGGATQDTVRTV